MTSYTNQQKQAITLKEHDILVSASAGSGKTTVLVQRLLQEILGGISVDQLLVVTFTKAAAQEMKNRIKMIIQAELNQTTEPSKQRYLRQQLNLIDAANISTIDAFCLDIIHRFYYAIDLDPSFSILTDETQASLMRERALHEIENEFLTNNDEDFLAFYNNFAGDRDAETARNLLLDLYNYAMAKPDYTAWLKNLPQKYQVKANLITSPLWQEQVKPYLFESFSTLREKINHYLSTSIIETKELKKVKESFTLFKRGLDNYLTSLKQDYDYDLQRENLRSCEFSRFNKSKKWDEDILDFIDECAELKSEANTLVFNSFTSFYATDEQEQLSILKQGQQIMLGITKAETALINRFNELKRAQNLLDYSDMEQLAYQILSQDTSSSAMARSFYQNKFKEIMVDEYQDINQLQENILQLIKKDKHNTLFMVGDVKQSIYGFRQANPSLFLRKYEETVENKTQKRILLADNFRSTKPIIKIVNQVFDNILTPDFGGIDYAKEGELTFGAQYYPADLAQATEFLYYQTEDDKENDEQTFDSTEIAMIISRIKQFKQENLQIYDVKAGQKRPFKYSDIAIITRSRSDNLAMMQEFANENIPLLVTDAKNYFQTIELTIIMNYLRLIDNPDQDIPLVTVLRSPLFNFKEPDLAKIRINSKKVTFYNALTAYVAINDELSQKIKNFLNQLASLRQFAANHRISELIWSIYERTDLLEIMTALPNGKQRRINLESLYERASSYESAGFKGLYQFINFIEHMRRSQKDLAQPLLTNEVDDSVKLMTIHGSKGLEFPIVFYAGLQHRFQKRDISGDYIITADNVGLTIQRNHYCADTLLKAIDNMTKEKQLLEEEARILYVGMTRARQKLILTAEISNFEQNIELWHRKAKQHKISLNDKLTVTNPLGFIGPALGLKECSSLSLNDLNIDLDLSKDFIFVNYHKQAETVEAVHEKINTKQKANYSPELLQRTAQKLYDFSYTFKDASQTTAYQSVSEIKKVFNDPLDTELENAHLLSSTNRYLQPIDTKPKFLFKTTFTGVEIGTAMHLLLQYYDYDGRGDQEQLDEEIKDLIKHHQLNPDIVSSLNQDQINWFVHSDFAKEFWQKPHNLKREIEFSSLIPASTLFNDFSDPDAKILIHGTIDGYFIQDDGIILFDYKTDYIDPNHQDEAIEKVKHKYTGQLRLYEQALNSFANKKVKHKYLILLNAQKIVEIK